MAATKLPPVTSFPFRRSLSISSAVIGGTLLLALFITPLIPTTHSGRTETVFVYGTLKNPWIRAYACRCRTAATPAVLPGYKKSGLTITPNARNSVSGFIIAVASEELNRLDRYENIPHQYRREQIEIDDTEHWVYIKN